MITKIVWGFDPETREYTNAVTCYQCPVNKDEYTLPAHFVPVEPVVGENEVAVANEDASGWLVVADYRGQVFYDQGGVQQVIIERGQAPDPTWAAERPLSLDEQFEFVRLALQAAIDTKARGLGFSGGNALMLYAAFENAYQSLALPFAQWEATVWLEANAYKAQVLDEAASMVTPEQAVAMMPELELP